MQILIEKDASTKVSKDVADIDAARAFASMGFSVQVMNEYGSYSPLDAPVEPDPAPVPHESEPAKAAPVKKTKKKR